ncbi:MAG: hypothetical protein WBC44_14180 [Planctomycetaceae bacterium]
MPPLAEVIDTLLKVVLPATCAAAIVFVLVAKLAPARLAPAAAALALMVGFVAGNHWRGAVEYRLDSERLLTPADLAQAFRDTFVPPQSEDAPLPPPSRYWLPWTAGLALLGGLAARAVPAFAGWSIRIALAGLATALAVTADLREGVPWFTPAFFAVVLAEWLVLERLAGQPRREVDERSFAKPWLAPAAACATFVAASIVLLHAHSARFVDIATIMAASLGTIALLAWLTKTDPASVAPGVAVMLPGLMLVGYQDTFSEVPTASFATIALAPLSLAALLLPRLRSSRGATSLAVATFFTVLAIGVSLAVQAESLSFE